MTRTQSVELPPARSPSERLVDSVAFSPAIPALLGFALTWAISDAIAPQAPVALRLHLSVLAACGSAVVYGLDRLRDRDRDRHTSPLRTAWVERNERALGVGIAVAVTVVAFALWRAPLGVIALCAALGGAGVLHRRLKQYRRVKTLYVSIAWTGVCLGLPWIGLAGAHDPQLGAGLGLVLLPCFVANLVASNQRDEESEWLRARPGAALAGARVLAAVALVAALLGPAGLRSFVWVPSALLIALLAWRPTEHYGHLAVDGALLAGAVATATLPPVSG